MDQEFTVRYRAGGGLDGAAPSKKTVPSAVSWTVARKRSSCWSKGAAHVKGVPGWTVEPHRESYSFH
eukprot:5299560-Ditylum_brightwellii.AAC.1